MDTATTTQGVVTPCLYPAPSINFEKEMLIRMRQVVEDPCRTTWNQSCPQAVRGSWTFGYFMAAMSGATLPAGAPPDQLLASPQAQLFVGNWLKHWLRDLTQADISGIGSATVQQRSNIRSQLLNRWAQDSGCIVTPTLDPTACHLDLRAAPFRLLAIANRADMAGFDYSTGGSGTGELRFVFAAYTRPASPAPITTIETGNPVQAEVIFEYRYPRSSTPEEWANQFHGLGSLALTNTRPSVPPPIAVTDFGVALQAITDGVVKPGAQPGAPNGSSIGQVRTLESAFDSANAGTWEFRQFQFVPTCTSGTCQLAEVQLPQTPPISANPSNATHTPAENAVSDFIVNNQTALSTSRHVVPASMLAGSVVFRPSGVADLWAAPSPVTTGTDDWNALIRHNFGFSTCNGCHYFETQNEGGAFHIKPRPAGSVSLLSTFLTPGVTSSDGGFNPEEGDYLNVTDPAGTVHGYQAYFQYNEPWRRSCEIRRVLAGEITAFSTATGHGFDGGTLAPAPRPLTHLSFEQTIPPSSTTHLIPGAFHGYEFDGRGGGAATITMTGATCGAPDTYLYLYGPKDADGSYGRLLQRNDDSGAGGCGLNSQIASFTLPADGNYLIVATSFRQAGTGDYQLQLHCEAGVCAL